LKDWLTGENHKLITMFDDSEISSVSKVSLVTEFIFLLTG
jgi:hypothetical protein